MSVPTDHTTAPVVSEESMRSYAEQTGVCARPLLRRLIDTDTGDVTVVPLPCGSTREYVCTACAGKARRLRMQQLAEGWHRDTEPERPASRDEADLADDEDQGDEQAEDSSRRVRSTRRRQDAVDLPRCPVEDRTIGQTWTGNNGQTYRPSMFVTLTLPSYGKVHRNGAPVNPGTYDYRRAALDALHLPKAFDRWMTCLRRGAGYKVQYFAAIETQRRLAGHLHLAIRGAIPRQTIRQVTAASYVQVWWPAHEDSDVRYPGDGPRDTEAGLLPTWDGEHYIDPVTGDRLPTWDQALDRLGRACEVDPSTPPAHVARFGTQVDIKGLHADSPDVDRSVRYLTKYLTKSLAHTHAATDEVTGRPVLDAQLEAHVDRLHAVLRFLPCSPSCSNWLRYGVQPKNAGPGLVPGMCPAAAHDRENAGLGGRRVLVSRDWTGKTLTQHRADRAAVIREVLEAAGVDPDASLDARRCAADQVHEDGTPRFRWEPVDRDRDTGLDYVHAIVIAAQERAERRAQYDAAKRALGLDLRALIHGPGRSLGPPGGACGQPFDNSDQAA